MPQDTGIPDRRCCTKCGVTKPLSAFHPKNIWCKTCKNAYAVNPDSTNPDRARLNAARFNAARFNAALWRSKHPDYAAARARAHPERVRAYKVAAEIAPRGSTGQRRDGR
jgi:hypothetical protein